MCSFNDKSWSHLILLHHFFIRCYICTPRFLSINSLHPLFSTSWYMRRVKERTRRLVVLIKMFSYQILVNDCYSKSKYFQGHFLKQEDISQSIHRYQLTLFLLNGVLKAFVVDHDSFINFINFYQIISISNSFNGFYEFDQVLIKIDTITLSQTSHATIILTLIKYYGHVIYIMKLSDFFPYYMSRSNHQNLDPEKTTIH